MKTLPVAAAVALLVGCSSMEPVPAVKYEDGQQPLPADYKSWPKFLVGIQRPDAKQVRDIYVNPRGYSSARGQPFPDGTTFVMENYAAAANADGTLKKDAAGNLVKGNLARVFVMGKGAGWAASAPADLRNGNWAYASYGADGKPTADSLIPCRACHLPLETKDFVHRYDEYFDKRGGY